MKDGYSNELEEKGFGTPFAIEVTDFVPKIFKESDSMWAKKPQSLGSGQIVKIIYSEKATKFCEISTNYLSYVLPVK